MGVKRTELGRGWILSSVSSYASQHGGLQACAGKTAGADLRPIGRPAHLSGEKGLISPSPKMPPTAAMVPI